MSHSPGNSSPESPIAPDGNTVNSHSPLAPSNSNVPGRAMASFRSVSDANTTYSSAPLGPTLAARKPPSGGATFSLASGTLRKDVAEKLQAFHASRMGNQSYPLVAGGLTGFIGGPESVVSGKQHRPAAALNWNSTPIINARAGPKPSLAQKRGFNLPGRLPGGSPGSADNTNGVGPVPLPGVKEGSLFEKYSEFVDASTGSLKFAGKAVIHSKGVDFSSGSTFRISLDEVERLEELGKGNYGTVYKVIHRKPYMRGGIELGRSSPQAPSSPKLDTHEEGKELQFAPLKGKSKGTGVVMAMKEIRLELDEAKFAQIIMELDILHKCVSPYIIDFYGAFFQEGAVYICMEYMDGGSIDKIYADGVPENVLRKIAHATVQGLKTLKDEHNIIHRDVKPTNILVNTRGEIKLCDFGVSGNLVASIAKTNIGCQSYMAPERITSGGIQNAGTAGAGTYSVQSDIWSLGLSLLECAMGCYPYPPETYNNIFSQLSAIVQGEPPDLPQHGFSNEAREFVRGCLHKIPKLRPTYAMLLQHPWISNLNVPPTIDEVEDEDSTNVEIPASVPRFDKGVSEWVLQALEKRKRRLANGGKVQEKPPLHAAPLDAVSTPARDLGNRLEDLDISDNTKKADDAD